MYITHDLLIDPDGIQPPAVVIKLPASLGLPDVQAAIDAAVGQLMDIGLTPAGVTRSARTPSGGWSISIALLVKR